MGAKRKAGSRRKGAARARVARPQRKEAPATTSKPKAKADPFVMYGWYCCGIAAISAALLTYVVMR